jgi:hypothetical protein
VRPTRGGRGAARGEGGLSSRRLAWLQATHRRERAVGLWLCLAAAVALPALLLVVDAMAAESGLAQTLDLDGGVSVRQDVAGVDAFDSLERQVDARAAARTGAALVSLGALATLGPLRVMTLSTRPAPAGLTRDALTAVYAEHLASHVAVVAGELPPEGLAGGETAVSMARAAADRLGLHLSDRLCGDFGRPATGQARWCARIVGLWQPQAADDPFWAGAHPGMELAMGRYDLFQLAKLAPPGLLAATIRYWAGPDATTPGGAAALAGEVAGLAADLRSPQRPVDSQLDVRLLAFDQHERRVSAAIRALAGLVAALGLGAAGLAAARLLDAQRRELALLRARGWALERAWLVAFGGPGVVGLTAAAAAIGGCLLTAAGLTATGSGLSVLTLRPSDVPGMLVALGLVAAALIVLLAALAAVAVWRDPRPSVPPAGRPLAARATAAGAAALGLAALLLPHLTGTSSTAPAGVVLLAASAAVGAPLAWLARPASVPGALARIQLARRPFQHAGAAFVLMLAGAGAAFAVLGLTAGLANEVALRAGLDVCLAAGAAGGVLLALAAQALHFRSTAGHRRLEYGGLFAHGMPPELVGRSLVVEQVIVAGTSLLAGCALGVAMALAVLTA